MRAWHRKSADAKRCGAARADCCPSSLLLPPSISRPSPLRLGLSVSGCVCLAQAPTVRARQLPSSPSLVPYLRSRPLTVHLVCDLAHGRHQPELGQRLCCRCRAACGCRARSTSSTRSRRRLEGNNRGGDRGWAAWGAPTRRRDRRRSGRSGGRRGGRGGGAGEQRCVDALKWVRARNIE